MCIVLHSGRSGRIAGLSRQELALAAVTAVWGSTFLVVHLAVRHSGPWFFVGVRFLTAGLASALVFRAGLRRLRRRDLVAGLSIGVCIFLGYGLQTLGLKTISSSTSAFITATYVPLVPLLQWAVFRKAPRRMAMVGVGLAFGGLVLLAGPDALRIGLGPGEIATMASTLALAGEILLIGFFAGRTSLGNVTVLQLLTAGVLGLSAMPVVGEGVPPFSWAWLVPAVGMGVASCVIQLTMNWAQRSVPPTRATLIYAGEPVWGGVVGRIAGDRLPVTAIFGALFIVAGVVTSGIGPRKRRRADQPAHASAPIAGADGPLGSAADPAAAAAPAHQAPQRETPCRSE